MTEKPTLEDGMIKQDFRQFELVFLVVMSSLQCVVGLTGNFISLVTIIFTERLNQIPSNLLILNLGFSDLLTCVVFLPFIFIIYFCLVLARP